MIQKGFIKIPRNITEWRWYKDANTFKVFFHLLLTANYEDKDFENLTIRRGQRVISQSNLAVETGLSVKNIRTAISHLVKTEDVAVERHNKFSVITINNYDSYQSNGRTKGDSMAKAWRTGGNNERKIKKEEEKEEIFSSSEVKKERETHDTNFI